MEPQNLLMVCVASFFAVFLLLSFLALVMKVLTNIFPQKPEEVEKVEKVVGEFDTAVLAAISASYNVAYPQTRISKVEQVR